MLKDIPNIISPELMNVLMLMSHGDEIVLADGNFPSASISEKTTYGLVRADGHSIPDILKAVMKFFPLDTYVEYPVMLMQVVEGDKNVKKGEPEIWGCYRAIIEASGEPFEDFVRLERFAFYDRARKAFAVVATGEKALYANIILKKGVVLGQD